MNRTSTTVVKGLAFALFVAGICAVVWVRSQSIGASRNGLGRSFELDLERYLDVDPALVMYDELEPVPVDMTELTAVAAGPDNRIYVGGDREVRILSADGKPLSRFTVDAPPRCLAVRDDGTLYVGVGNHIEVFDAKGTRTVAWESSSDDAQPASIAFRGDDIFVAELTHKQVLRYDSDGRPVDKILGLVVFSSSNIGIAVDPQQRLWVANPGARELRRYDKEGGLAASWNRPGRAIDSFSGCCNPVDITIRADGSIVTAEKNIVRVKVVSSDGKLIGVVAGPRSFDQGIVHLDIAGDSTGRILVLDPARKAVRIFVEKET